MNNNISDEPKIHVGILLEQPQIEFQLHNAYRLNSRKKIETGKYIAVFKEGKILFNGNLYDEIIFSTDENIKGQFTLNNVIIGVNFHWERKEDQVFLGSLKIKVENNALTAINLLHLESYLASVISSEMSATSSLELLKAHAVISRSWLMAQIDKNKKIDTEQYQTHFENDEATIRWYDREDHLNFDVCADDHCQRYQGITRQTTETVANVTNLTRGEILIYDDEICDARFSKCCGGMMETFENVWEPVVHPYLQGKLDSKSENMVAPNLTNETEAETWIRSSPKAFCNTNNKEVLKQVLNDYDQETADFFRWKVEYSQLETADLIKEKSGIDFGEIIDLLPLERGTSGRLTKLKIIGTKRTMIIGKELEIRRTLSRTHLYSSAFVVDKEDISSNGIPQKLILTGCGWGHGVGLCQIGAATMAEKGYGYKEILNHYFPGSALEKYYE